MFYCEDLKNMKQLNMMQKYKSSVYCDSYKALDSTNKCAFHVSPVIKVRHEGFMLLSGAISNSQTFLFPAS